MLDPARLSLFAVCAPGLERLLAGELAGLGLARERLTVEEGGVAFAGNGEQLVAANLCLRTASRVLLRLGEFHAGAFDELERGGRRLPWPALVAPGDAVRFRVSCRGSRLYHSGAVAERLAATCAERVGPAPALAGRPSPGSLLGRPGDEESEQLEGAGGGHEQLFVVRMAHDRCQVSADTSGELLHRRGYRLATAKAPLRETLAAAMLLASGWRGQAPLLDPMCGAGTIVIEAALLAGGRAPGLRRRFRLADWPRRAWPELGEQLAGAVSALEKAGRPVVVATPGSPVSSVRAWIRGSDRDAGAIAAAIANAGRAGVAADVDFRLAALSAIDPPPGPGWLVANLPYGIRSGEQRRLPDLYAQLAKVVRASCRGWRVAMLSADPRVEGHLGKALDLRVVLRTTNGGLPVRLWVGSVR